jgi:hypothetical protein
LVFEPQLGNFGQNYSFFGPHDNKNLKKHTQNVERSLILDSSLGRRKLFFGRMQPVGRKLAGKCIFGRGTFGRTYI